MGDGSLFSGNFLRGLRHGTCEWKWRDGRKWEGEYFQGKKHNEGHTILLSGKKEAGNRGSRQNSVLEKCNRMDCLGKRINNWKVSIIPTSNRSILGGPKFPGELSKIDSVSNQIDSSEDGIKSRNSKRSMVGLQLPDQGNHFIEGNSLRAIIEAE